MGLELLVDSPLVYIQIRLAQWADSDNTLRAATYSGVEQFVCQP